MITNHNGLKDAELSYDLVYVVGPGLSIDDVKKECGREGVKCLFVGDGTKKITSEELESLPKVNYVVVDGHGETINNIHTINLRGDQTDSQNEVQEIYKKTGAKNILFLSCEGGGLVRQCKNANLFAAGTTLFAPSSSDAWSLQGDGIEIAKMFIREIKNKTEEPLFSVAAESSKTIAETMLLSKQTEQGMKYIALRRTDRELYGEVEKFINYRQDNLNGFIQKTLGSDVKISADISPEHIKSFRSNSIKLHVLHDDVDVIKAMITNKQLNAHEIALIENELRELLFPTQLGKYTIKLEYSDILAVMLDENLILPNLYMESAVKQGKEKVVNTLLKYGANPDPQLTFRKSLSQLSMDSGWLGVHGVNFNVTKALIDAIDISKVEDLDEMREKLQEITNFVFSHSRATTAEAKALLDSLENKINLLNYKNSMQGEMIIPEKTDINYLDKVDFINELIEYNQKNCKSEQYHFHGLFETNKENNTVAITKLLKALHGDTSVVFDNKDISACNNGDLGVLINKYRDKKVLPAIFLDTESPLKDNKSGLGKS